MPRRLLTSTLFPYTTLFRSVPAAADLGARVLRLLLLGARRRLRRRRHADAGHAPRRRLRPERPEALDHQRRGRELLQDRKSTRLNSSHVRISYAVFCLKKKK